MAYIGKQPTAVPLTSSDITDGIVTTAKIADDAVDNTKLDLTANYAFTGTITGAGSLSLVTRTAVTSDVGQVDFTNLVAGGNYLIVCEALRNDSNGEFFLRASSDNGSTFLSSGYQDALWQFYNTNSSNIFNETAYIPLSDNGTESTTANGFHGHIWLSNVNNSSQFFTVQGTAIHKVDSGNPTRVMQFGGYYNSAAAIDAVRISVSAGNITGSSYANVTLYRVLTS